MTRSQWLGIALISAPFIALIVVAASLFGWPIILKIGGGVFLALACVSWGTSLLIELIEGDD